MIDDEKSEFLDKLIPWAWFVENQTQIKAIDFKNMKRAQGLSSVVFTCEVIIKTDWGQHPMSKEKYKGKTANNLTLMEATPHWDQTKVKFKDKEYKTFDNWEEYCIHYSDWIVFSGLYKELLLQEKYTDQLKTFALVNGSCYTEMIELLQLLGIKHE